MPQHCNLSSFVKDSSALVLVTVEEGDVIHNRFSFVLSSFEAYGFEGLCSLQDIFDNIDPHNDLTEGIGKNELIEDIRKGLLSGVKKKRAYLLPLKQKTNMGTFLLIAYPSTEKAGVRDLMFVTLGLEGGDFAVNDLLFTNFKDTLTGLFNYKTLLDHVHTNHRDIWLCLFDLNKFKAINDTYGHLVGDEVLIKIAEGLIAFSTEKEIFYRRSGDEFFIMSFCGMDYAIKLVYRIEQLMKGLSRLQFGDYKDIDISASFGIVELKMEEGHQFLDGQFDNAMLLTDYAMYRAKEKHELYHVIDFARAKELIAEGRLRERVEEESRKAGR